MEYEVRFKRIKDYLDYKVLRSAFRGVIEFIPTQEVNEDDKSPSIFIKSIEDELSRYDDEKFMRIDGLNNIKSSIVNDWLRTTTKYNLYGLDSMTILNVIRLKLESNIGSRIKDLGYQYKNLDFKEMVRLHTDIYSFNRLSAYDSDLGYRYGSEYDRLDKLIHEGSSISVMYDNVNIIRNHPEIQCINEIYSGMEDIWSIKRDY